MLPSQGFSPHKTLLTLILYLSCTLLQVALMADLTATNRSSPPWRMPLPISPHQLSFSPFPPSCATFFQGGRSGPQPQGFTTTLPPPAYVYVDTSGSVFYGYLYFIPPPIQPQLKGGPSMEHQNQPSSSVKIAELDGCSGGTGVFHPPYIIRRHGPKNNNKRRNKRGGAGKKNEKAVTVNKERVEGSSSKAKKEKEAPLSSRREDDYEVLLPSEWPY